MLPTLCLKNWSGWCKTLPLTLNKPQNTNARAWLLACMYSLCMVDDKREELTLSKRKGLARNCATHIINTFENIWKRDHKLTLQKKNRATAYENKIFWSSEQTACAHYAIERARTLLRTCAIKNRCHCVPGTALHYKWQEMKKPSRSTPQEKQKKQWQEKPTYWNAVRNADRNKHEWNHL